MSNLELIHNNIVEQQTEEEINEVNNFNEDDFGSVLLDINQSNQGMLF